MAELLTVTTEPALAISCVPALPDSAMLSSSAVPLTRTAAKPVSAAVVMTKPTSLADTPALMVNASAWSGTIDPPSTVGPPLSAWLA